MTFREQVARAIEEHEGKHRQFDLQAAAAIGVVLAEARAAIEKLNGDSYYEEDGGLIDMGDAGQLIDRKEALAALAGLAQTGERIRR